MWGLIALAASILGTAAATSSKDESARFLALHEVLTGLKEPKIPTLLESLEYAMDVYAIYIDDDEITEFFEDKDSAIWKAERLSQYAEYDRVTVERLRLVPAPLARELINQKERSPYDYDDDLLSSSDVRTYLDHSHVWNYSRAADTPYSDWPEHAQDSEKDHYISSAKYEYEQGRGPQITIGQLYYTGTADKDVWSEEEDIDDSSETPLTNDKYAARRQAKRDAKFLDRVYETMYQNAVMRGESPARTPPHQPMIITWRLREAPEDIMFIEYPHERKLIGEMFEVDLADLDYEDLFDTGQKMSSNLGHNQISGLLDKDAHGPGAHSILLFDSELEFVSVEPA